MDNTDYRLYGGRIGQLTNDATGVEHPEAFACLHTFMWQLNERILYRISAWHNTNAFDTWKNELSSQVESNTITNSNYFSANANVLDGIKNTIFSICNIDNAEFNVDSVFVCTRNKQTVYVFSHKTEERKVTIEFNGNTYDAIMATNLMLGYQIVTLAWDYSDSHGGKFSEMVAVTLPS